MKNKQTVIEWFASELSGHLGPSHGPELLATYNLAILKEKEQIIEAYEAGVSDEGIKTIHARSNAEQYYNDTFG
jgi:hypothetical protein